ncbi:MAG: iron-containing alcohol dehydrogenase, partial [Armatimonadetes bacterium]|nr:iron-containing alcohol dehydrogenase [Armatimonadota bacterium]
SGGINLFGHHPSRTALAIAQACFHAVLENGAAALKAVKNYTVTNELETLVEASILMSGVGVENGGVALAHGICNSLDTVGIHDALHGEKVAYGNLVQCVVEDDTETFYRLAEFYDVVGLPISLEDLGWSGYLEIAASKIAAYILHNEPQKLANEPRKITKRTIIDAILETEQRMKEAE